MTAVWSSSFAVNRFLLLGLGGPATLLGGLLAGAACGQAPATAPPPAAVDAQNLGAAHASVDDIIAQYADSGVDGVVDIVKNPDGEITKMVVVGAARISTVLGAADGLQTARNEARLRAVGKFRQFLEEKVTVTETSETERTIKLEGDGANLTESGKKISKNTEKYKTFSEGMVRGMQTLGFKTVSLNQKERMHVVVMGWSKELANQTRALANELDKPRTGGTQPAAVPAADAEERRRLEDRARTLPGARGFFDNK
jgi:hypothetical protein